MTVVDARSRIAGCVLGGAVGDALGGPIEFMSLAQIRKKFGAGGLTDYEASGEIARFTDDTQMTIFTIDALIRADNRYRSRGICNPTSVAHRAYLRWLETQQGDAPYGEHAAPKGWLLEIPELRHQRAPGTTCMSALRTGKMGTPDEPLNDSKGCGGVMRVAPIGFVRSRDQAFDMAAEWAAITHGHPSGYLAAGFLAAVIHGIAAGESFTAAIGGARMLLTKRGRHEETLAAVDAAVAASKSGSPSAERVEGLGAGWVAEEALAISLYCALVARTFAEGVRLAVNHSGDSDSTGAITGNILGTLLGRGAIPRVWLDRLELRATLDDLAYDLWRHFGSDRYVPLGHLESAPAFQIASGGEPRMVYEQVDQADYEKYPGY